MRAHLMLLTGVVVAAGCSSAPPPAVTPAPTNTAVQDQSLARAREDSVARADAARAAAARLAAERRADSLAESRRRSEEERTTLEAIVHFDFDRADLRTEDQVILDHKIPILRANPAARIVVAGNCDERGSDEYNLALGNRRAIAVRQYLTEHGIDPAQIQTTSYGEEHPLDPGHTEAAWARNRNDQFSVVGATILFEP